MVLNSFVNSLFPDNPAVLLPNLLYLSLTVLVALYEETDKPNNALEYPFLFYSQLY